MPNYTHPEKDLPGDDLPDMPEAPVTPSTAVTLYDPSTDGILVKLNPMLEAIQQYSAKRVKDMVLTGLTRKQIRDIAHEKLQQGVGIRTEAGRIGKALKEEALKTQRGVNKAVDNVESLTSPIETEWRQLRDKCDAEEQAEKDAAQKAMEEKVSARAEKLIALGISVQTRFFKGAPWALLAPGSTPITVEDLSVFGESLLWSMTDEAFENRLANITKVIDGKIQEQVWHDNELKRLQLDERLRTRITELQSAEVDPTTIQGLREMDDMVYQPFVVAGRKAIQARQEAVTRQQQEQAAALQRQTEALARQQAEIKDGLRTTRLALLKQVNGVVPTDDVTDMELDLADMDAATWGVWLTEQTEAFTRREKQKALNAKRDAEWNYTPGIDLISIPSDVLFDGLSEEEFQQWRAKAIVEHHEKELKTREFNRRIQILKNLGVIFGPHLTGNSVSEMTLVEFEDFANEIEKNNRIDSLRSQRTSAWRAHPGNEMVLHAHDLGLISEEQWIELLDEADRAERKRITDIETAAQAVALAAEQARAAMQPDMEALHAYTDALMAVKCDALTTDAGRTMLDSLRDQLNEICTSVVLP